MICTMEQRMGKEQLYKKVADRIQILVENGTFRPGDRVPSIRELSRQAGVSINTVKTAYSHLEDRRVIEARPQAGYFVVPRLAALPKEPAGRPVDVRPREISASQMVLRLMRDAQDPAMVQFGAAIPDPAMIPAGKLARIMAARCRQRAAESAGYEQALGDHRLRSQIARRLISAGCTLDPAEIIVTNGGAEAMFIALQVLCRPGDTVAVSSPCYFNFIQMFGLLGVKVVEIPNSPSQGLHLESLQRAMSQTRLACCLVISNYDNPLGSCLSDNKKQQLVRLLAEGGVPLIEDDINGDICHLGDRPSVAKAWDREGGVLLCSSFSKTLAPGYRVGWLAPGRYFEEALHFKLVSTIASPTPTQLAMAEFLANGGYTSHLRKICRVYASKTAQMREAVAANFPVGTRITRPQGGFTLWVELPGEVDTVDLYAQAAKLGITLAPGRLFSPRGAYANCLRLNAAFWCQENRWAVEALGKMAAELLQEHDR